MPSVSTVNCQQSTVICNLLSVICTLYSVIYNLFLVILSYLLLVSNYALCIMHYAFPAPCSLHLAPCSFIIYYIIAVIIPINAKVISTAPVILLSIPNPFSLNSFVLMRFTSIVRVNHHSAAPIRIEPMPTMDWIAFSGFMMLNRANSPMKRKIIMGLLKQSPNAVM